MSARKKKRKKKRNNARIFLLTLLLTVAAGGVFLLGVRIFGGAGLTARGTGAGGTAFARNAGGGAPDVNIPEGAGKCISRRVPMNRRCGHCIGRP